MTTSKRCAITRLGLVLLAAAPACKDTDSPETAAASSPSPNIERLSVPQPPPPAAAPPPAAPLGPRPSSVKREQVAAADAVGAWFRTVKTAAQGSAGNCERMARALQAVGAKGRPIVDKAKAAAAAQRSPAAAQWLKDYTSGIMQAGFEDLMTAVGDCAEHPEVKKAIMGLAR